MGSSSKSKNKGGDIIVQGSILAAAQIIVRLIGLFYRIPLQRIAGDVAMGYYGYAYDIYMLLLLVSSNGVPLAVSKLVSKTHAKRDYTNERRIMVSALLWTLVVEQPQQSLYPRDLHGPPWAVPSVPVSVHLQARFS